MLKYKLKVANVMGLDANNSQYGILIVDALDGINDPEDFVEYLRTRKDGIEYANRIEKLDTLSYQYKKSNRNMPKDVQALLPKYCKDLEIKFKEALPTLREHEEHLTSDLSQLKLDKAQWFTNKEIDSLNALGGIRNCINVDEEHKLYDKLYEVSIKRYLAFKKQDALTDGQKRVQKMIGGVK